MCFGQVLQRGLRERHGSGVGTSVPVTTHADHSRQTTQVEGSDDDDNHRCVCARACVRACVRASERFKKKIKEIFL